MIVVENGVICCACSRIVTEDECILCRVGSQYGILYHSYCCGEWAIFIAYGMNNIFPQSGQPLWYMR